MTLPSLSLRNRYLELNLLMQHQISCAEPVLQICCAESVQQMTCAQPLHTFCVWIENKHPTFLYHSPMKKLFRKPSHFCESRITPDALCCAYLFNDCHVRGYPSYFLTCSDKCLMDSYVLPDNFEGLNFWQKYCPSFKAGNELNAGNQEFERGQTSAGILQGEGLLSGTSRERLLSCM